MGNTSQTGTPAAEPLARRVFQVATAGIFVEIGVCFLVLVL